MANDREPQPEQEHVERGVTATNTTAITNTFAWLIESSFEGMPIYWDGQRFSPYIEGAIRYARREDAQRTMDAVVLLARICRPVEHGWYGGAPTNEAPDTGLELELKRLRDRIGILERDRAALAKEVERFRRLLDERTIESLAERIQRQMCGYDGEKGRIREREILTTLRMHFWTETAP